MRGGFHGVAVVPAAQHAQTNIFGAANLEQL